jgi:hypothetical protein
LEPRILVVGESGLSDNRLKRDEIDALIRAENVHATRMPVEYG